MTTLSEKQAMEGFSTEVNVVATRISVGRGTIASTRLENVVTFTKYNTVYLPSSKQCYYTASSEVMQENRFW